MRIYVIALCACACSSTAFAEIIVNSARPITRRVTVQLIQTALDDGMSPATVFGNASQRANIEASIDAVWAQAGIDIAFLPAVILWSDTFAHQGSAGSGTRPGGDLNRIFSNAASEGGILNADPLTLNLVFADVVPAFEPLSANSSAGYARINGNGIVGYAGANLLGFQNGLDVIASVMAHEIGHNLGLDHIEDDEPNLMSPGGSTEQLNGDQIGTARASRFARAISAQLAGDYNGNGVVEAADYVVWRKTMGQTAAGLPADGNNNGRVDTGDYTVWRTQFGAVGTSGAATAIDGGGTASAPVPEPSAWLLILFATAASSAVRRRIPRCNHGW